MKDLEGYKNAYVAEYAQHNFYIIPLQPEDLHCHLLQGALTPETGGWYHGFPKCRLATTVTVNYSSLNAVQTTLFIITPRDAAVPEVTALNHNEYQVKANHRTVLVNFNALDK